jgi:dCMP deaminase
MSRLTRDAWAMQMAQLTAQRGTCLRRQVGCVLLNGRGHVLSTGYNGVASGMSHCNEVGRVSQAGPDHVPFTDDPFGHPHACPGAHAASGTNLDGCHALHAEQNALLQCRDPWSIDVAYITASPCMTCTKLLLNTSCYKIVFLEQYPHPEAQELWESARRTWHQFT